MLKYIKIRNHTIKFPSTMKHAIICRRFKRFIKEGKFEAGFLFEENGKVIKKERVC